MNRIRQYKNNFQVLISPHQRFNSNIEYLLGNWDDLNLDGFNVISFSTLNEAKNVSYKMPDLNWDQLVLFNKNNFINILNEIQKILNNLNFNVDFYAKILNSQELKETMFSQIIKLQNKFRLALNLDFMTYIIIHPNMNNLELIANDLILNQILKIQYKAFLKEQIILIGKNDIGVTFKIILKLI